MELYLWNFELKDNLGCLKIYWEESNSTDYAFIIIINLIININDNSSLVKALQPGDLYWRLDGVYCQASNIGTKWTSQGRSE